MAKLTLVIGNKMYSSWSLRPWLALKHAGAPFDEIRIPLYRDDSAAALARHSPTGKVPVLLVDDLPIWESLAICEYVAEAFPEAGLWPADRAARAYARSAAAEMHAGFAALRGEFPMNCRGPRRGVAPSLQARADVDRISEIWRTCRARFGHSGPWLFGSYSIADAMYAPVTIRMSSYEIPVADDAREYIETTLGDAAMREWLDAAFRETEVIAGSERGEYAGGSR